MLTLFLLFSCDSTPVSREVTNNVEVPIDILFVKDGCTMYRFEDGGHSHYFARCDYADPPSTTTLSPQSCGKGCIRIEEIQALIQGKQP